MPCRHFMQYFFLFYFVALFAQGVDCPMNTPSKSKAEGGDPSTYNPMTEKEMALIRRDIFAESAANARDAETLRALQFALAPLDRAMRDADVESWPRQLMHRTVFPSLLQSAEDERRERNLDLEYESRVDYASWETDREEDQ